MKKYFIFLIILTLLYGEKSYSSSIVDTSIVDMNVIDTSVIETSTFKLKLYSMFKAIDNGLDYILTGKGAVKMMVLISPFFMFYCYYFDAAPIQLIINRIVQSVGKAEEVYLIQKEIGKTEAFWETMESAPLSTISVVGSKLLDKTVYVGLPYIAGLITKSIIGGKK